MPSPPPDIQNALRLRRWAWGTLQGERRATPDATAGGWRLFLDREACAAPLARALGAEAPLPIRIRAADEAQKVLLARAELGKLGRVMAAKGLHLLALKGTRELLEPDSILSLKDLDLLCEPATKPEAEKALQIAGLIPQSESWLHLALVIPESGFPVELHAALWPEAEMTPAALVGAAPPAEALPGIQPPAAADHLWLSLVHTTLVHPDRSGRLRDLLLIRAAAVRCLPAEVEKVRARATGHRSSAALLSELEVALGQGTPDEEMVRDRIAAGWYALDAILARVPVKWLRISLASWTALLVAKPLPPGTLWQRLLSVEGYSRLRGVAWLERTIPPMGAAVRVALRLLWALPVIGIAIPLASRARAIASAVGSA